MDKLTNLGGQLAHMINMEMVTDSPIIIDAGANVGWFIERMKSEFPNVKLISIEPGKTNMETIKSKFGNTSNVKLLEGALVGVKTKKATLTEIISVANHQGNKEHGENRYHQWHNLYDSVPERSDLDHVNQYEVKCYTLEDILSDIEKVDYLKMDIEGSEYDVIETMTQEVADKISQLSYEDHTKHRVVEAHEKLKELGFNIKHFAEMDETYAWRN